MGRQVRECHCIVIIQKSLTSKGNGYDCVDRRLRVQETFSALTDRRSPDMHDILIVLSFVAMVAFPAILASMQKPETDDEV